MKLASLQNGRDGTLIVVSRDLKRYSEVPEIAPTLQAALDDWAHCGPRLKQMYARMNDSRLHGQPLDLRRLASPLPRAYQWCDGSAYVNHVELVRKARKAEMPASFWTDPLMYQGGSDDFLPPQGDIRLADEAWGIDFEAEVAVIVDDVPMGVSVEAAARCIRLVMLVNDVSLRNLIPNELAKGFGFFHGKPSTAFSPVAVCPEELGPAWDERKINLPLRSTLNGTLFGEPEAGIDMTFDFAQLIAHAAKTRNLRAGAIVGSGTVSNTDRSKGSSCLAEKRTLETIDSGKPVTPFMRFGDRIRIEMFDAGGQSIFGAIDQTVVKYEPPV